MGTPTILDLSSLARPSGAFAMVAIDQRESLRTMFGATRGGSVHDRALVDFKVAVAERLAPVASAMLFDRHLAMPAFEAVAAVPSCARILAADDLVQAPGGPVDDTCIDVGLDPLEARALGAVALKLLLIWRGDENRRECVSTASRFVQLCRRAGLLCIVEAIVKAPRQSAGDFDREAAIVEAAGNLGSVGPDLYKCEVPFQGRANDATIARVCEEVTSVLPCPWVVLSQGVSIADYPHALEIACGSGASGFLAGRAVWADTLADDNYRAQLDAVAVPRLRRLVEIVDRASQPWQHVSSTGVISSDPA